MAPTNIQTSNMETIPIKIHVIGLGIPIKARMGSISLGMAAIIAKGVIGAETE